MGEKLEKVKKHVKDNKVTYIVGGTCLVVGALGGAAFVLTRPESKILTKWCWKPTINQIEAETVLNAENITIKMDMHSRSEPGWWTYCVDNNTIYPSQRQAALDTHVNEGDLSSHLNGKRADAGGKQFRRIARAPLPPEIVEQTPTVDMFKDLFTHQQPALAA